MDDLRKNNLSYNKKTVNQDNLQTANKRDTHLHIQILW